jgi:hypothetical protein
MTKTDCAHNNTPPQEMNRLRVEMMIGFEGHTQNMMR